ncbi:MAG TPA: type 2 isopentenyl-diphosphate Delta-isomerase [Bdellovibrionota bacterium]|jgi:isopentenyl-diphosphate delta-isomerase
MNTERFESRKADHLRLALDPKMEALGESGFDQIRLTHEALPELNFSELKLETKFFKYSAASPCFVSSMTAGHLNGEALNLTLAKVASSRRWPMGLGSQRRELTDPAAKLEWTRLRRMAPNGFFLSNLGLSQLIVTPLPKVLGLVEALQAGAIIIHTNPMQECLQPEGTPQFKGGLKALEKLCKASPVPVVLKETGCGFSKETLSRLGRLGLAAIDLSGYGGTHWGRIEGGRAPAQSAQQGAALTFAGWGESTVQSLIAAASLQKNLKKTEIWASGGIRSGLDAAKSIAMGARKVGFAKPALEAALKGEAALDTWMTKIEFELKVALFCSGNDSPDSLRKGKKWQKI